MYVCMYIVVLYPANEKKRISLSLSLSLSVSERAPFVVARAQESAQFVFCTCARIQV